MRIIVQKFGGTSVTTSEKRNMVINKVMNALKTGYSPVVVVSAIGRKGDPYATDTLLSLINPSDNDIENREVDLLMCCGEIISAVVMSKAFAQRGIKTSVLTGGNAGIITDGNYGSANVLHVETERILRLLEQGIIPIITGFQGMTQDGDYTTLGRGGSDVTGALLGKALKAECIEIYTDVDGIMTADPRIVPDAKVIREISYSEVFQLADQGAKVIHPRAVEYAMKGNVPLKIKNTTSDAPGTTVTNRHKNTNNVVTGITGIFHKTQFTVSITESYNNVDVDLFELFAKRNITIDFINVFENHRVFSVSSKDTSEVESILRKLHADYKRTSECSKIAVLGNDMRSIPDMMTKILKTLERNHVNVLQTANTNTTIWCLIKEQDTVEAMNVLHNLFFNKLSKAI